MSSENNNISNLSLAEIIAASRPDATIQERSSMKERISEYIPANDMALNGAIKFLEDTDYNFDELYSFLETPLVIKPLKSEEVKTINFRFFSYAACFILICISMWFFVIKSNSNTIVQRAAFYEPGLPVFASIQGNKEFNEMISSFRLNNTKEGLFHYHALLKTETKNDTINYFAGWLYFNDHQYDSALLCFNNVENTSIYTSKSKYLKGLSNYLNGDKKKAKSLLESISKEEQNIYSIKAKELIKNKRLW